MYRDDEAVNMGTRGIDMGEITGKEIDAILTLDGKLSSELSGEAWKIVADAMQLKPRKPEEKVVVYNEEYEEMVRKDYRDDRRRLGDWLEIRKDILKKIDYQILKAAKKMGVNKRYLLEIQEIKNNGE